ncbi:MAG: outer membrane beta-barrel protein [Flavobacteriales bacterium]
MKAEHTAIHYASSGLSILLAIGISFFLSGQIFGQNSFRPGLIAGTNFSYPDRDTELSEGFFTIYRSGLQGGVKGLFTFNNHFVIKTGLMYVTQSVGLRGEDQDFKTDVRVNHDNLLMPVQLGYQNKLGTLILRELLGISLAQNLSRNNNVSIENLGSATMQPQHTIDEVLNRSLLPMINVGIEIGSIFKNDAGFFIGVHYRQGLGKFYQFNYRGNYFNNNQFFSTKSNFLSIELTYYFSRPSYWFKKEFEF